MANKLQGQFRQKSTYKYVSKGWFSLFPLCLDKTAYHFGFFLSILVVRESFPPDADAFESH